MTTDEIEIVAYLQQNPEAFFARKEIARRAKAREEYEANPHWAVAPLNSLVQQGMIEQNENGQYRLKGDGH